MLTFLTVLAKSNNYVLDHVPFDRRRFELLVKQVQVAIDETIGRIWRTASWTLGSTYRCAIQDHWRHSLSAVCFGKCCRINDDTILFSFSRSTWWYFGSLPLFFGRLELTDLNLDGLLTGASLKRCHVGIESSIFITKAFKPNFLLLYNEANVTGITTHWLLLWTMAPNFAIKTSYHNLIFQELLCIWSYANIEHVTESEGLLKIQIKANQFFKIPC